jgi:alkylhydroperoxidase family enzyme
MGDKVANKRDCLLACALSLAPAAAMAWPDAHVPALTDRQAWKKLPAVLEGSGLPLPAWIRAVADSLPKTAAAMIELDYAQRAENPLPPRLRAKLRWIAAHANRCPYAMAYARADFVRAGGKSEDTDSLPDRIGKLPEKERLALQLVRQLTLAAYTITDDQVARLVELYGEKQVVAIVLVAAYANFQDRLLLALGVPVEADGPLAPVKVRFAKAGPPAKGSGKEKDSPDKESKKPNRKLSPPAKNPPPVPKMVDDPEWTAISFASLEKRLAGQMNQRRARIPIPDWKTVKERLPRGVPRDKPMRIKWSLLNYGYQPRLAAAWIGGLRAFRQESDLDMLQQESMFWVVARSLQCFY